MISLTNTLFELYNSERIKKDYDEDSSYQNKIPESREWWEPV